MMMNDDNENDYVMICCLRQPKRCVYSFVALRQLQIYLYNHLLQRGSQIDNGVITENAFLRYRSIFYFCKAEGLFPATEVP